MLQVDALPSKGAESFLTFGCRMTRSRNSHTKKASLPRKTGSTAVCFHQENHMKQQKYKKTRVSKSERVAGAYQRHNTRSQDPGHRGPRRHRVAAVLLVISLVLPKPGFHILGQLSALWIVGFAAYSSGQLRRFLHEVLDQFCISETKPQLIRAIASIEEVLQSSGQKRRSALQACRHSEK